MQHLDEAHAEAEGRLAAWLAEKAEHRVLLVKDVLAWLRVILWCPDESWETSRREVDEQLTAAASDYWSKSVLRGREGDHPDESWQEEAWAKAKPHNETDRLRTLERRLSKGGWFDASGRPPWPLLASHRSPGIVLFYSFKGGTGRSTALAATALHLASAGTESVAVLDADLDAPGVGSLLAGDDGAVADWGIADFLVEQRILETELPLEQRIRATKIRTDDYHHRYATKRYAGMANVFVFPAGRLDDRYLEKLARIDYGESPVEVHRKRVRDRAEREAARVLSGRGQSAARKQARGRGAPAESKQAHERANREFAEGVDSAIFGHPFEELLRRVRSDLHPGWILVDGRSGLGDGAGFLTGGLCHFHVLLATLAEASWQGLPLILDRLGRDRVRRGREQAECMLVASMVPRSDEELYRGCVERFTDRARDVFSEHYYAEPEAGEGFWTRDDLESDDAPHVPIVLPYDERLATFRDRREGAEPILLGEPYAALVERLQAGLKRAGGR